MSENPSLITVRLYRVPLYQGPSTDCIDPSWILADVQHFPRQNVRHEPELHQRRLRIGEGVLYEEREYGAGERELHSWVRVGAVAVFGALSRTWRTRPPSLFEAMCFRYKTAMYTVGGRTMLTYV